MGKTRDLFKKIRDTKGTFHAKMGSIKDRNGMDLTEAEDIKKRMAGNLPGARQGRGETWRRGAASVSVRSIPFLSFIEPIFA